MFCNKCGKELKDGEVYCSACGTAVQASASKSLKETTQKPREKSARGKSNKLVLIIAAVLVVAVGAGSALYLSSDGYKCKKYMRLAEESYRVDEYEDALEYYKAALKLDDTLADAYLRSSDIYAETGE